MNPLEVVRASAALEVAHLRRNRVFVLLTALAAVSFVVMVSLFGLTGAYAPVALIDLDGGTYARDFIEALNGAHHSFTLKYVSAAQAHTGLRSGRMVGIITIPAGFSANIERGATVPIDVQIDNVNVDLTHDVQRALPAAIVAFGRRHNFPGARVQAVEHDVLPHDTGYIPYLVVSALALDAMVIAGILGALATAREFERKTIKLLRLSPASAGAVLAGTRRRGGGGGLGSGNHRLGHRPDLWRGTRGPVGYFVHALRLRSDFHLFRRLGGRDVETHAGRRAVVVRPGDASLRR